MSKTVWMFPGQGAQKVGMAKDFYENSTLARQLFDEADAALDFNLKDTCFEENEQIHLTEYTQPCLVTACLAMAAELRKRGFSPDMTAGLSLGEYAAIAAAGGMIMLANNNSARADYGSNYTLQCILIVVLGGVSPNGGKGKIGGVLLSIFLVRALETGLNRFPQISSYYISLVWGAVLLLVMVLDYLNEHKRIKA